MINNTNKNVSVWRGDKTPPTEYHVWIKSNGSVLINKDGTWLTLISESTNDSVNVCNLSDTKYVATLLNAILYVKQYLGSEVFHVGYKLRYNEAPIGYDPVWKEYILTGSTWQRPDNWKLVSTTDLMNNEEIIKSGHLPSYVDDVLEYSTIDEFPSKGESGKIYLDTSTNKSYRWSGTLYVLIALTDIVTSESDGLMSSEMYLKLEKTASDLDIHDRQNLVDFAEIREALGKKVGKIVDSKGNIISEGTSVVTIPDGTSDTRGLLTPDIYKLIEDNKKMSEYLDDNKVDFAEIRLSLDQKVSKIVDSQGNIISDNASIATIPDGTSDTRGLLTPDIYKLIEDNKKMSEYLDDNKVEEIRDFLGTPFLKVGSIVTIPDATSLSAGLMTPGDKIKLDSIESEFVKDLGLVASTDEGDLMAARSEIAGNVKISFIRYRTAGVRAEKVTTIFLWRNGINETALIKFVDKALWRRNVTGATGVAGAPTNAFKWERTGAHYLGYDAANREIQLMDYNLTVFKTVLLPLALNEADNVVDGLISSEDIASIITKAEFNRWTGEIHLKNKANNQVTSLVIPPATEDGMGLMSGNDVIEIGTLTKHRTDTNNPHQVTKAQIGLSNVTNDAQVKRSEMGVANGVATLNSEGKISSSYLPSYVSAVITADSYATLPATGEEDKIYVTKDTNLTYRWSGTAYIEISPSIALGETSTTAYAGDKGKYLFDKVTDLSIRVGSGWVDTENGFVKIGTGSDSVSITPGATIHASIEGDSSGFTISSSTDLTYLGYGANIGKGAILGLNISAAVKTVRDPNGALKSALVLESTKADEDICLKMLCSAPDELKLGTATNLDDTGSWVDLARMEKISTMIDVETNGLAFYPSRLTGNSNDEGIILGTSTVIGSNINIGSYSNIGKAALIGDAVGISNYVKVSTSIEDDGTGYILLGDKTTKIKKGVTIDGNSGSSGSSELRVHEYTSGRDGSWMIGINPTPNTTGVQLGKGIVIIGTNETNLPILIKAQNRNNATALIGANFKAYSGVTLGTNATFGDRVNLKTDVVINAHTHIGEEVSIGNNVSIPNNFIVADKVLSLGTNVSVSNTGNEVSVGDVTISTGIRITKNDSATTILNGNDSTTAGGKLLFGTGNIIWSGVEIGTGVEITQNLTANSDGFVLGKDTPTYINKGVSIKGNIIDTNLEHLSTGEIVISLNDGSKWLTLEESGNILSGNFLGGADAKVYPGAELGTGVVVRQSLVSDLTSYKLGETNLVIISKGMSIYCSDTKHSLEIIAPTTEGGAIYSYGIVTLGTNFTAAENTSLEVSLGTGSIDTISYYRLTDPRGIMLEGNIGSGVTIGPGIQIRESDSGGIQIYVPSLKKWITIN